MSLRLDKFMHTDPRGERSKALPKVNLSAMAKRLGIGRAHLSRVVNGEIRPGRELLFKMSKVLEGSVEEVDRWLRRLQKKAA